MLSSLELLSLARTEIPCKAGDRVAHFASELDLKRLLKNSMKYYLQPESIVNAYKTGYMVISDVNCLSFCYPVEYFDGILIRYYTSRVREELMDMAGFISSRIDGKLFLPHISLEDSAYFSPLGFKNFYKITGMYKTDYNISLKSFPCSITGFNMDYYKDIEEMDKSLFPYNWRISLNDISSLSMDRNINIRICTSSRGLAGFTILRTDSHIGYGYIIKIAVKRELHRSGIGTLLINDSIRFFKYNKILPVFTDTITEASQAFFEYNGFKSYSNSFLLVRE